MVIEPLHQSTVKQQIGGPGKPPPPVPPELVEEQLEELVNSEGFRQSVRMIRFLTHVVRASLRGDVGELKETSIGVSVYDRDPGYDPKLDPVVRNEARRLRQKLQQHYDSKGLGAPIRIMLPRGGYAPAFSVQEHLTAEAVDLTAAPIVSSQRLAEVVEPKSTELRSGKSKAIFWLVSFLVLAVFAIEGRSILDLRGRNQSAVIGRVVPLTSVKGQALHPSISPDGTKVAFTWDGNTTNFDIYVTQKDGRPLRLTTDAAFDLRPSWSPDGRAIAYLRSQKAETDVMLMEVPGGQPKRFFSLRSPLLAHLTGDLTQVRGNPGPSWTPDSQRIVYSDQNANGSGLALFERTLQSGVEKRLTQPEGESRDYSPIVSKNGRQLAFIRSFTNSAADLFVMPLSDGLPHRITSERADILGLSWLGDDRHLLFSSNRTGPYSLWVVDTESGSITAVPTSSEEATDPSADAKGDRIVFADTVFSSSIQRLSVLSSRHGVDLHKEALFSSAHLNNSARYSPDNTRIAFISDRSGTWELWVADAGSNEPRKLTHFNGPMVGTPHWSPDGKHIVFDARPSGVSNIFLISADEGEATAINPDMHEAKQPYWSHDGAKIYFYSDRDGSSGLWKTSPDGHETRLICHCAATDPQESTDGKTIYFTSRTSPGLFQVNSSGGDPSPVPGLAAFAPRRLWEVMGQGIFFVVSDSSSSHLQRYDFSSRTTIEVTMLPTAPAANTPSLSVSSDQHSVLLAFRDESWSNIKLIENENVEHR